jgi:hypothetical protein
MGATSSGRLNFWFGSSDSVSCWNDRGDSVPLFAIRWREQLDTPEGPTFGTGERLRFKSGLVDWLGIWNWAISRSSDAVFRYIERHESDYRDNVKVRVVARV